MMKLLKVRQVNHIIIGHIKVKGLRIEQMRVSWLWLTKIIKINMTVYIY